MISGMMGNTMAYGYLDIFNPVTTPQEARATIQGFIDLAYSDLSISELWEYGSCVQSRACGYEWCKGVRSHCG